MSVRQQIHQWGNPPSCDFVVEQCLRRSRREQSLRYHLQWMLECPVRETHHRSRLSVAEFYVLSVAAVGFGLVDGRLSCLNRMIDDCVARDFLQ